MDNKKPPESGEVTWSAAKNWSEQDRRTFESLCVPLIEFIRKKGGAHTAAIVQWDRAAIVEEAFGAPFPIPD